MENKPCPCEKCPDRLYFARQYDIHFWGEDCIYICPRYDQWKLEKDGANDG